MIAIIMSGGLGKRMNSDVPKVLQLVNNKPMIYYVIRNAFDAGALTLLVVVGKYKTMIKDQVDNLFDLSELSKIQYIYQPEPYGTGHAIQCCIPYFIQHNMNRHTDVLILSGDMPMLTADTIKQLSFCQNTILITELDDPTGYGRIVLSGDSIQRIVEEKDGSSAEKQINHVNCGIYYITVDTIFKTVMPITANNAANEYYLTDFLEYAFNNQICIQPYLLPKEKQYQIMNINTPVDLERANNHFSL